MARFFKTRSESKDSAPGSLIFIGNRKMDQSEISIIDYSSEEYEEKKINDIGETFKISQGKSVTWINIAGIHDTEIIKSVGEYFKLHPLLLEDILFTGQQPKLEEYENCIFVSVNLLDLDDKLPRIYSDQFSMVIGSSFVITFQETSGTVFDPVRERIRNNKGRIRKAGADYLAYTLLDTIVDNYIHSTEIIGEQVEDLEQAIIEHPDGHLLNMINSYKREINFFLRSLRPVNLIMTTFLKHESLLIEKSTFPYFRDLNDLVLHCTDTLFTYRELLSDYLSIYQTGVSNRMNEVMKVLTMFSAIFIPLTFIAGVYGTNFLNVPEYKFRSGYFIMWGVMVVIAIFMFFYFKRKKWL